MTKDEYKRVLSDMIAEGKTRELISYYYKDGEKITLDLDFEYTEKKLKNDAKRFGENVAGVRCCEIIAEDLIEDLIKKNLDKLADWFINTEYEFIDLEATLPYKAGIYYSPDGKRHITDDYSLTLFRISKGYGLAFGFLTCYCPKEMPIRSETEKEFLLKYFANNGYLDCRFFDESFVISIDMTPNEKICVSIDQDENTVLKYIDNGSEQEITFADVITKTISLPESKANLLLDIPETYDKAMKEFKK